jgi:hypothetical protein
MNQWYQLPTEDVLRQLGSDATRGLSATESRRCLLEYGPNELQAGSSGLAVGNSPGAGQKRSCHYLDLRRDTIGIPRSHYRGQRHRRHRTNLSGSKKALFIAWDALDIVMLYVITTMILYLKV